MLTKQELVLIRNAFSIEHVYSSVADYGQAEVDYYTGCVFVLRRVAEAHCKSCPPSDGVGWLIRVIFNNNKNAVFITGRDAHVHVMVALDTMVNMAQ